MLILFFILELIKQYTMPQVPVWFVVLLRRYVQTKFKIYTLYLSVNAVSG